MRYAAVRQNASGTLVQDLGEVDAVRVYSPIYPGRYAEFSLDHNGLLKVTYENGNSRPMPVLGDAVNVIPEHD